MQYIDFHVHAFADKIAERTISALAAVATSKPATNGTLADTEAKMRAWGVDGFAVLCIATKPSQHLVCNNWAASVKSDHIFPFGSVHPDGEDALSELERIKSLGLYGIKLHPDYQHFFADEERLFPIYRKCGELGLPIIFHAGLDPVSPEAIHCTPQAAAKILDKFPETTMIMAHLGGNEMWETVERELAGKFGNLYFDTALAGSFVEEEQLRRIIEKHGADKILLASDCPWDTTDVTIAKIRRLGLSPAQEAAIFSGNAKRLLG
ncbi:MAG: amidohydrolase family protein, partial [Oscillospiraceae bacterium]|nr:amidohydrolase family protein [Oscillospiraceae bacterium]